MTGGKEGSGREPASAGKSCQRGLACLDRHPPSDRFGIVDDAQQGSEAEEPQENVQVHEIGNRRYIVADVEPLDVDGVRTVAVGTGLWLLAFVMLLPFYGRLVDSGRITWLWTCVAGFGLGALGWDYCRRRRRGAIARRPGEQA